MLQQPLQQKQITNSKRLILAARRHVASRAREGGKDFARGAFAIPIEGGVERGRTTLGDRSRDTSRMLIRRRGFWLGSAHGAASANQTTVERSTLVAICVAALAKSANPHLNAHSALGGLMWQTGCCRKQSRMISSSGAPRPMKMGIYCFVTIERTVRARSTVDSTS